MTIQEKRWMNMDDLRELCIRHEWFTRGDCKAYDKFLNMPYDTKGNQRNITTKLLYSMARTIMRYSDPKTYDIIEVGGIMYSLGQICTTTFYVSGV